MPLETQSSGGAGYPSISLCMQPPSVNSHPPTEIIGVCIIFSHIPWCFAWEKAEQKGCVRRELNGSITWQASTRNIIRVFSIFVQKKCESDGDRTPPHRTHANKVDYVNACTRLLPQVLLTCPRSSLVHAGDREFNSRITRVVSCCWLLVVVVCCRCCCCCARNFFLNFLMESHRVSSLLCEYGVSMVCVWCAPRRLSLERIFCTPFRT